MKVRNLEKTLELNKTVVVEIYDLNNKLTYKVDFEYENGHFYTIVEDSDYELITLLGNCDVESIFPCIFDSKLCLNIVVNTILEEKEKILSTLRLK